MARQSKKIRKRISPKSPVETQPEKPGSDIFLIIILLITAVVLAFGWSTFDDYNKSMYLLLMTSLVLTYTRRHSKLSETAMIWVERASYACIGLAAALFFIILYHQFT